MASRHQTAGDANAIVVQMAGEVLPLVKSTPVLAVSAGADIIVAHVGLTSSGRIGAKTTVSLDDAVARIQVIHDAATRTRRDVLVLCHGGPIAEPDDAAYVLARTKGVVGFFGASSIERLPAERAIVQQVKAFKSIRTGGARSA